MAGTEIFSKISLGKETTKGAPVARTRRFYGTVAGNFDIGDTWNFHETENRALRTRYLSTRLPTQTRGAPTFKLQDTQGIGYDDLVQIWSMGLLGGLTGVGGTADKTWSFLTNNATSNVPEAFTMDVGDDVQNWILQYVMPTRWKLSTDFGGVTHLEADLFAQQAIKGAATAVADVAIVKMPADLWTIKFAANYAAIAAQAASANFLRTWSFEYQTGIVPRFYADGTLFLGQHVETDVSGLLHIEVESTALGVSELVDKYRAGTMDYVGLKITGPTLGGTAYSLLLSMPIFWDNVKPLSGVDAGVNLYAADGHLAYDVTATKSLSASLVCALATIP